MIRALSELSFEDVFEEISTGKIFIIKNFDSGMVEVREANRKRFWAWPISSKVRVINKKSWEQKNQ